MQILETGVYNHYSLEIKYIIRFASFANTSPNIKYRVDCEVEICKNLLAFGVGLSSNKDEAFQAALLDLEKYFENLIISNKSEADYHKRVIENLEKNLKSIKDYINKVPILKLKMLL